MADILAQLKNIGLSDNEAKVYLAMLELGPSPVLEISAKSGVNRPTTYVQIESLKKMGLVSTQTKGKKQLFVAESPEQLESVLEQTCRVAEQKKSELEKIMPELKTIFNLTGERPQVRFFEGKEGLIKMGREFLKAKEKKIIGLTSIDDVLKVFPEITRESYSSDRVKRNIESRSLYTSSKGPIWKRHDKELLREAKFIPPEKMPFSADITVFDDKVAIAALKGRVSGAIIEHREIADSFRGLFELVWNLVDKL